MELEIAAHDRRIDRANLLVSLNPYLETMIAPVILDLNQAIYASDTYLGPGTIDPTRCTLVRGKKVTEGVQVTRSLQLRPIEICADTGG
ncbi:MAG: hypothetical protein RL413_788 [Actinomycetota bacterium]